MEATEAVIANGIVPVVVLPDHRLARELGQALSSGGINVAEVTFRTEAAVRSIEEMSGIDNMVVGAGTVINPSQVDAAVDAGAQFIVSPGLLPAVVQRAHERGVLAVPGTVTPSEIMLALSFGLTTLKFFPANVYGGPTALAALGAPFRDVKFIPTGGVNLDNLSDYCALPNVAAVGGTWMVKPDLLEAGAFDQISELSRRAVDVIHSCRKELP